MSTADSLGRAQGKWIVGGEHIDISIGRAPAHISSDASSGESCRTCAAEADPVAMRVFRGRRAGRVTAE
jgi:hypothetical protein